MEKASRIMYTIANIFTWILVGVSIVGIVLSSLALLQIMKPTEVFGTVNTITYYVVVLVVALITIYLVRIAKSKNSSKGWDILFMVLGIIGSNIFYFLGGLFGLIARR